MILEIKQWKELHELFVIFMKCLSKQNLAEDKKKGIVSLQPLWPNVRMLNNSFS